MAQIAEFERELVNRVVLAVDPDRPASLVSSLITSGAQKKPDHIRLWS